MPRGNRTGPWGEGPRTGRGLGICSGYDTPGFMQPGPGRGLGMGLGFRRGAGPAFGWGRGLRQTWRRGATGGYPYAPPQPRPEDELRALKEEAETLTDHLEQLNRHIEELEKKD